MQTREERNRDPQAPAWNRRTPRTADVVRLLASWFLTFLALLLTADLLPGFTYTSWLPLVVAAAVTGLVGMIVRPVLVTLSALIGWIAVGLATIFGQALVMSIALAVVPGASFDSFWT
ncbi:MAG TPA: phage holin family protein, partial [Dermatophilaceae bacterium]|nr:phage holin family protein [Dermatophilaceae bacterium]